MLAEFVLLIGILVLILLESFDLHVSIFPVMLLLLVACFIENNVLWYAKILSVILSIWVLMSFEMRRIKGILLLFSLLGAMILLGADHWLWVYLGLELMALPIYALSISNQHSLAKEAGLKYFVMGSIGSLLILYGMSYCYLDTGSLLVASTTSEIGSLGISFLLLGIFLKLGIVPFHMWVPDIYQTAPLGVVAWVATVPKIAIMTLLIKIMQMDSVFVIWVCAILSMLYGVGMALLQSNLRRFLAYASFSHMGMIILSLSLGGMDVGLFYLLAYIVMNMALFACLGVFEKMGIYRIEDLLSLGYRKKYEALLFTLVLVAMAGIPPLAGFMAKLNVLSLIIAKKQYMLALLVALLSAVSGYYYLILIQTMYFEQETKEAIHSSAFYLLYAIPVVVLGVIPNGVLLLLKML